MKSYRKVEQDRHQETFRVGNLEATSRFKRATHGTPGRAEVLLSSTDVIADAELCVEASLVPDD